MQQYNMTFLWEGVAYLQSAHETKASATTVTTVTGCSSLLSAITAWECLWRFWTASEVILFEQCSGQGLVCNTMVLIPPGHAPGEYCSLLMEGDQRINLVNYIFSSRACRPHTLVQWTGKCVAVQWSMWITKKHANWPAGCKTFGLPKEDQWKNKSRAEGLVHH